MIETKLSPENALKVYQLMMMGMSASEMIYLIPSASESDIQDLIEKIGTAYDEFLRQPAGSFSFIPEFRYVSN